MAFLGFFRRIRHHTDQVQMHRSVVIQHGHGGILRPEPNLQQRQSEIHDRYESPLI